MGIRNGDRHQCGAHDAEYVALDEASRPPVAFEVGADKPEREHVEKYVTEAGVQQRVRDHLPHFAMHHAHRNQRQPLVHCGDCARCEDSHRCLEQVNGCAGDNDAPDPSGKGREAERDGLSARHFVFLSLWLGNNRQTAMSRRIDRAHSEYLIILRNAQGCTRAADRLDVLPVGGVR